MMNKGIIPISRKVHVFFEEPCTYPFAFACPILCNLEVSSATKKIMKNYVSLFTFLYSCFSEYLFFLLIEGS